ncbi:MAG: MerR family transcriptional regulator [Betaproteobacteria bacterium]
MPTHDDPTSTAPDAAAAPAPDRLTLDDLACLAGVTSRTVRFYIQQGLVSRPEGAKRGAFYVRRHVEQLLMIRRWTDAGLSLDRIRELVAGAPQDPPPRSARPGTVEVWSRVTLADGLEIHLETGRAGLAPEQVRALVRAIADAYHAVRSGPVPDPDGEALRRSPLSQGEPT